MLILIKKKTFWTDWWDVTNVRTKLKEVFPRRCFVVLFARFYNFFSELPPVEASEKPRWQPCSCNI